MSINQVVKICQQLKSEGKEPSVALIKARMVGPKPIPLIISGLKHWQNNPNQQIEEREFTVEPSKASLEQRVTELEQLVEKLSLRLSNLETQA